MCPWQSVCLRSNLSGERATSCRNTLEYTATLQQLTPHWVRDKLFYYGLRMQPAASCYWQFWNIVHLVGTAMQLSNNDSLFRRALLTCRAARTKCSQSESAHSLFTLYCAQVKKHPSHPYQSLIGLKTLLDICCRVRAVDTALYAAFLDWLIVLLVAGAWKDQDTSQQWLLCLDLVAYVCRGHACS